MIKPHKNNYNHAENDINTLNSHASDKTKIDITIYHTLVAYVILALLTNLVNIFWQIALQQSTCLIESFSSYLRLISSAKYQEFCSFPYQTRWLCILGS
jgi:hypothetical protein